MLPGVGGALVLPATLALVAASFRAGERGLALGIWSGAGAAALGLGPLAGALVTEQLGWAWIFLLNVPLGVVGLLAARLALPTSRGRATGGVDLAGLAASGTALFALVFALSEAGRYGWSSPVTAAGSPPVLPRSPLSSASSWRRRRRCSTYGGSRRERSPARTR